MGRRGMFTDYSGGQTHMIIIMMVFIFQQRQKDKNM